jgi:hypothetical protein
LWATKNRPEAVLCEAIEDYSTALTMSSMTFFASPKTIIVLPAGQVIAT